MPQPNYQIVAGRVQTRSLEVHIVDHCNLRCHACCSLSPYLPKWTVPLTDFERDLRAAKTSIAPSMLKLVGGEPLLHPEIDECLRIARRQQVAPIVSVTTNAILLPRMSEVFWQLVQALTISLYPLPKLPEATIHLAKTKAAAHGIPINWKQQDSFVQMDLDTRREDDDETLAIYRECWLRRRCHLIRNGRFYTCTRPPHLATFYEDENRFVDDGFPLHEGESAADALRAYLQRDEPLEACALCRGGDAAAAPHRQMSPAEMNQFTALRRR
jgi:GTP 3',8-cyclase